MMNSFWSIEMLISIIYCWCRPSTYWKLAGFEGSHARSRWCLLRRCLQGWHWCLWISSIRRYEVRGKEVGWFQVPLARGQLRTRLNDVDFLFSSLFVYCRMYFQGESAYIRVKEDYRGHSRSRSRSRSRSPKNKRTSPSYSPMRHRSRSRSP